MKTDIYKLCGLLAFVIAWASMVYVVLTQGVDSSKTISNHAALSKRNILLLAVMSPISMLLFSVFALFYIAPTFNTGPLFIALSLLANLGYVLAAWVPATTTTKTKIHDIFAYGASLMLIPISLILASTASLPPLARYINAFACAAMLSILCIMLFYKKAKQLNLYYQVAYFLAFDIALLSTLLLK